MFLVFLQLLNTTQPKGEAITIHPRTFRKTVNFKGYPAHLPELLAQPGPHYVLFTAGYIQGSEIPWCPDCSATLPVVREMVMRAGGSLLEVSVGEQSEWSSPAHPLKLDSRARVVYVPTLYQWTADGSGQSISRVLSQRATIVELRLAVAGFMQSTANGYE
ncbi:MAG: hypothetical protein WDW38_006350 [Sanguina aurantia]